MHVSAIKMVNTSKSNQIHQNNVEYLPITNTNYKPIKKVSFQGLPTLDLFSTLAGYAAEKGYKLGKDIISIKNAKKAFLTNPKEGLKKAIELKVSTSPSSRFIHDVSCGINDFLNNVANYASKLSDNNYENVDLKKRFLESVFLKETYNRPDSIITKHNSDEIPKDVKSLFKNLDNNIYGEFKKHLIYRAIFDKKIILTDTDSLLDGAADKQFIKKIKSEANKLYAEFEEACERGNNYMDTYHPGLSG